MKELIGKKVTVISHNGASERQDVGVVEDVDSVALKLKKEHEVLYFPITSIRLVKLF